MSISGHKTENIYRRYDIVAERDLSGATARMDQYFTSMEVQSKSGNSDGTGTLSGTPEDSVTPEPKGPSSDPDPNS